jgi:hypothetical protein
MLGDQKAPSSRRTPRVKAEEFASRGVPFSVPLTDSDDGDDGLRGFVIKDLDGYGLFFGHMITPKRDDG